MCSIYVHFNNVALRRCAWQVAECRRAHTALKNHPLKEPEAKRKKKEKMVIFGNMSGILTVPSLSEETSTSINILLKNEHVHRKLL